MKNILTEEEAKLFYELWIPLLDYVNKKYRIEKALYGMTLPSGLPLESVSKISEKLWDDVSIIDDYLKDASSSLLPEHMEIISKWKKAVHSSFVVERHLQRGSIFVCGKDEKVYLVRGIYSTIREVLERYPMPQRVKATLIPFGDVIIYDAILIPDGEALEKCVSDETKAIYKNAKETGNIIEVLE